MIFVDRLTALARLYRQPDRTLQVQFPDLNTQAQRIWARQTAARSYRVASVTEALGVPSILSAVTLISGTVGRLSLECYQNGVQITDRTQIPPVAIRPNPMSTPREFFLKTAYYMSTRGEFWWFVAHRDADGNPDALFPIPPWEITIQPNPANRLQPNIFWLGKPMALEDMRHQIYMPDESDPAGVRGVGPLQRSHAAVSVAVEADAWAGNFFSGKLPSMVGTTDQDLDENDLKALDAQWAEKDNNLPRWMTNGMKLEVPPYDAQKAQLTEGRQHQVGEVARMFDMPGPLLEYQMGGRSLVYRNASDIWSQFQQQCLSPHYLEPIEQEMSDLLVRNKTARFSTWELTKADILTRYQVYQIGVATGMYGPEVPQQMEGLAPGDVNFAPVPPSPPAAIPDPIPQQMLSRGGEWRCSSCGRKLAEEQGMGTTIRCRCGTLNVGAAMRTLSGPAPQPPPQVYVFNALPNQAAPQVTMTNEVAAPDLSVLQELGDAMRTLAERDQPAPIVNVSTPEMVISEGAVRVEVQPPNVNVEAPTVTIQPPEINVAPAPPANVEVYPPPITIQPPNVTVNLPEQKDKTKRLERDKSGRIIRLVEEAG